MVNSLLPGVVKLKFEYSHTRIVFLDLEIFMEDGILKTDLHIKPTNKQLYLDFNSNHPNHGKEGIPYSQVLRVIEKCSNSASANGGPRSPSAHAWRSAQPPIGTSGIFPAQVSAESPSNMSPSPSEVISKVSEVYDKYFRIYLKLAHFPVKIGLIRGVRGVPEFFVWLESSYFCYLGAHAKI